MRVFLFCSLLGFSLCASAQERSNSLFKLDGKTKPGPDSGPPFYFDLNPNAGYVNLSGGGLSQSQTLGYGGVSATAGFGKSLFVGVTAEYGVYNQISPVNNLDGDFEGYRQFVAPAVIWRGQDWLLKLDYQAAGDYKLTRLSSSGSAVSYTEPNGGRVALLYNLFAGIHLGLNFESITFTARNESGQPLQNTGLRLQQYGAGLACVF